MINCVALSLVLTSIITAGIFSPTPDIGDENNHVIVKEGHHVVVVEYDQEGIGNTKVVISPHQTIELEPSKRIPISPGPKDVICDAFGHCKERIADVAGKVHQSAQIASEKIHDLNEGIKETVTGKTKQSAQKVSEEAKELAAAGGVGKVKETIKNKAKDAAETIYSKAGAPIETAKDLGVETLGKDIGRNLSDVIEPVVEKAKAAEEVAKEGGVKQIFRQGREVMKNMVKLKDVVLAVVHMLGFSVAYGTCVWVTFISSYVLPMAVPRSEIGLVQSKIYQVYFRGMATSVGLALVAFVLGKTGRVWSSRGVMFQGFNLLLSVAMVMVNLLYVEPRASKVMFERMKLEKEEGRGGGFDGFNIGEPSSGGVTRSPADREPLKDSDTGHASEVKKKIGRMGDRLKKMNSYSALLNLSTLMTLSWHLVYLAQNLVPSH